MVAVSGAAAIAGLAGTQALPASASVRTGGGVAGGGWLSFGPSEAQFSVFGSRFEDDEAAEPIVVGSLIWVDAAGFSLTSTAIESYGPDPDVDTARIMTGMVEHSQTGNIHSFWLRLNDLGGPGDELDTIELIVGDIVEEGGSFATPVVEAAMIVVSDVITVGDVQLLTFDFGTE